MPKDGYLTSSLNRSMVLNFLGTQVYRRTVHFLLMILTCLNFVSDIFVKISAQLSPKNKDQLKGCIFKKIFVSMKNDQLQLNSKAI